MPHEANGLFCESVSVNDTHPQISQTSKTFHVLVVADSPHAAVSQLRQTIESMSPDQTITWQGVDKRHILSEEIAPPDLLIVCLDWPDEWSRQEVNDLITRYPLSRIVCSFGPWCDGDGRNRTIWPEALRVPAAWLPNRIGQEINAIHGKRAALPVTASRDDRFLYERCSAEAHDKVSCQHPVLSIQIITDETALRETWKAMCDSVGWITCQARNANRHVLLWDADVALRHSPLPQGNRLRTAIRKIQQQYGPVPVVAAAGFIREYDRVTLLTSGVSRVVSKLAPLSCLIDSIMCAADDSVPIAV